MLINRSFLFPSIPSSEERTNRSRVDSKLRRDRQGCFNRKIDQPFVSLLIKRQHQIHALLKVRSAPVVCLERFDVLMRPVSIPHDFDIDNIFRLRHHTFCRYRNRQPLLTVRCFDQVSISPAMLVVLNVIVEHEHVGLENLVEVSAPRNIRWLQNDARFLVMLVFTGANSAIDSPKA